MNTLKTASAAALALSLLATPASANNERVENAIKNRKELASFYEAMLVTGVNTELREGKSYTVFAPTNEAFARITKDQYPCFYSEQCKEQIADVVRNHIVPGEEHVEDVIKQKGALFSIDKRQIPIGMPNPNKYTADGQNIIRTNGLIGSMLYTIDGVIANPRELSMFTAPVGTTTTQRVISYSPVGTVDAKTTIVETTTTTTAPEASPAR
ncbi:MAG: fasciclin domain-containing protein [Rickettsiales bacterium]|nr:fasciclin domain-containing protein [Rickettsiales bacterium]